MKNNKPLSVRLYDESLSPGDIVLFEDTDKKPYVGIFSRYFEKEICSVFRMGCEEGDELQVIENIGYINATPQNERTRNLTLSRYEILRRKSRILSTHENRSPVVNHPE